MCYGAIMCLAFTVHLPPVYLNTFKSAFGDVGGLSDEQLGRIPAFMLGSLAVGIIACGPLADRWGAKLLVLLGLACGCAGLGVMGAAGSYEMLLASACLIGLGAGMLEIVLSPIVCALRPDRRASAMNWLHSFYCTGAVCMALFSIFALQLGISWRVVCFAMMAFPAAVIAGFARVKVPPLVHENTRRESVATLLRQPYFLVALTGIFLVGATEHGMVQWLPSFAERSLDFGKTTSRLALAGFMLAMALGRILTGAAGHRIKPIRLMLICCIALAALFLAACFCPYGTVAISACIAAGLMVSCLWPTMLAVTADRFPGGGASMFAALAASGNVGCFIMPWIIGVVAERTGALNIGLATTTLCPAAMIAVLLWLRARKTASTAVEYSAVSVSES